MHQPSNPAERPVPVYGDLGIFVIAPVPNSSEIVILRSDQTFCSNMNNPYSCSREDLKILIVDSSTGRLLSEKSMRQPLQDRVTSMVVGPVGKHIYIQMVGDRGRLQVLKTDPLLPNTSYYFGNCETRPSAHVANPYLLSTSTAIVQKIGHTTRVCLP